MKYIMASMSFIHWESDHKHYHPQHHHALSSLSVTDWPFT